MEKRYFIVFLLLLIPLSAFADNGRNHDVENLGWVSIGTGIVAMIPIIASQKIKKYVTSNTAGVTTIQTSSAYNSILNLHIILNSVAYFAGMTHGFFLARHLDSISLSLALTMTVMMISGILLKYSQLRNVKLFNRLLHGQILLVILLMILICLHVITRF